MLVSLLVGSPTFGPDWNSSMTIFGLDIHGPQRTNLTDLGDLLTFITKKVIFAQLYFIEWQFFWLYSLFSQFQVNIAFAMLEREKQQNMRC